MGAKKTLPTYKIFNAQAVSSTTSYNSLTTNITNLDNISLQIDWTGTNAGSFDVLVSNDDQTFHSLNVPNLPTASGSSGGFIINLNQVGQPYIKLSYTNASGSGVLTASIFGKDLN